MTLSPILADPLHGLRHGFFTRQGGVSTGIFDSLNVGQGSSDAPEAIEENRARIAAHLGVERLVSVRQVHSGTAVRVTAPWSESPGERPEADAMTTDRPGLALVVLTADCAPVLLADARAGVIGAAHAGWKGALGGVLEATVTAMRGMGATQIAAAVGPCIGQSNYEVGPEFFDSFNDDDPENTRFFAGGAGDRMRFDLPGYVLARLRKAGVEAEWTGHCTYADEERFFSHRRAGHRGEPDYGRLAAAIMLDS